MWQAHGTKPVGGGLYVEAPNMALLSYALFESNSVVVRIFASRTRVAMFVRIALVQVANLRGYGGAVYVMSGHATLIACTLLRNVAKLGSSSTGLHASGGAVGIGDGATLELFGSQMQMNEAGGKGLYETLGMFQLTSDANRKARAAHIDCAGTIVLTNSKIAPYLGLPSSSAVLGVEKLSNSASAFIVGSGAGVITLRDCLFESAVAGVVLLRLVGLQAQSLVRGCKSVNVTVDIPGGETERSTEMPSARFAIVNCTFQPPLPNLSMAVKPPQCSDIVAGERVCDARASCEPRESGGVQCACVDDSRLLQDRPGVVPDGRQCKQATQVDLHVQSKMISLRAQKPGNYSEKLAVTVRAKGETTFTALYSLDITHYSNDGIHTNATWPSIHDQRLALNGFSLNWDTPPSNDSEVSFNVDAGQYTSSKEYVFQLRLDCAGLEPKGQHCISDGDRVATVMQIGSPSDSGSMRSEIRFIAEVEALVSCEYSQAWVERNVLNVPPQSSIRVHFTARCELHKGGYRFSV